MSAQWYYMLGEKKLGPVTAGQLKQLAQTGQLQPTDQVWKDGMKSWVPAEKVKGLIQTTPLPIPKPKTETTGSEANEKVPPPPSTADCSDSPIQKATDRGRIILTQAAEKWQRLKLPTRIAIGVGAAVVVLLFGLLFLIGSGNHFTPDELATLFNEDRAAAESEWVGKTIVVEGVVSKTNTHLNPGKDDSYSLDFRTSGPMFIRCYSQELNRNHSRFLNKTVSVQGEVQGVAGPYYPSDRPRVYLKNCVILGVESSSSGSAEENSPAYDEGYAKGVSIANDWIRKLRSMTPVAQREFIGVFRNQELRAFENNRDQVVRAYGASSDQAQRYTGLCQVICDTMKDAGFDF